MKTVGIIGGSGFIGSYNTKKFLAEGYRVKVSARDITKKERYEHLNQLPNAEHLEIVPLNVENKSQLTDFLQGCNIVVHGGTPFQLEVQDPQKELFDPTIKGTENFLEAIQETPGIEKVVFIASVAAMNTNFPLPPDNKKPDDVIDESDSFMSEESHPYAQAKFIANQTVEKFINNNPNLGFEISTVSPVWVVGKALSNREDSASVGMQYLFKNKIAPNPLVQMMYDENVDFGMVAVSDIADGVYKSATKKGIHGKNYLLASESYSVSDISLLLNHQEPKEEARIVYQNELAKKELGMQFQPAAAALREYEG